MTLSIKIKDGKIDRDELFQQLDTEVLLAEIRSRNELDRVVTINEMSDLSANRFRPLMCKVFNISEMCDDSTLMAEFCERVEIREQTVTVEL